MKRMLCFAALAVLLWSSFAMAANSVVVQSKSVAVSATGQVIGVKITNDVTLAAMVIPLTIRSITPGSFITALAAARNSADRLTTSTDVDGNPLGSLQGIKNINRFAVDTGGTCLNGQPGGFKVIVATGYTGPWTSPAAALFVCGQLTPDDPSDPLLVPGTDSTTGGALKLTVSVTSTQGYFEVDTTCTNPANHLSFADENNAALLPSFTKGLITIGTPPANNPPVARDTSWTTGQNTANPVAYLPASDPDAGSILTYSILSGPPNGGTSGFNAATGAFLYTPTTGYTGPDSIKFQVCDNGVPSLCATGTVRITVAVLNNPPNAVCQNVTVDADSTCHAAASIDNGSSDPDVGDILTLVQVPPGPYTLGVHNSVMLIVTDNHGAADTCFATITVQDVTKPKITCPASPIVQNNDLDQCGATVTYALTVTDNCSTPTVVYSPPSGSFLPVGTTNVRAIATDGAGNKDTCYFDVEVHDTQKPGVTCPSNVLVSNDPGQCGAVVNYNAPTVTDNCPGVKDTASIISGSTFPVGVTPVKIIATDASGNKDSCTFTVTVQDTTKPTIACPGNMNVSNDPGQCSAVVTFGPPQASDNCPGATAVSRPPSGSTFPKGTTTVYWVATDSSGNKDSCAFSVIVADTEKPKLACPSSPYVATIPAGQTSGVVTYDVPVTDNCPGVGKLSKPASGSTLPLGDIVVLCVATDVSGNKDSCSFTLHVVAGNSPPSLDSIGPKTVTEGSLLSFNIQAHDPDGDSTITLSMLFPPSGSTLTPGGPGAGTFSWTPGCDQGGSVIHMKFVASDGALADTENVDITVIDKPEYLVANPDSLVVHYQIGSPKPAPYDVDLSDPGCSGQYAWHAVSNQPWLSASPDTGTTPSTAHVSVDPTALSVGAYDGTLTFGPRVSALSASVGLVVRVHLTVGAAPHDSVWVTSGSGKLGDTVAVDVNFCNNHVATGITVGLHYPSSDVRVVSASFAGSRVVGLDVISADLDTAAHTICLSALPFTPDHWIPEGCGKLATLRFVVASLEGCPGPIEAAIDSFTVGVGCEPLLTDTMLTGVHPSFVPGAINIICPGHICGVVKDTAGNLLAGAVVQLWDSYPSGQVLDNKTTVIDSQFCFEGLDRNGTFDLRVYRSGYCPEIMSGVHPNDTALVIFELAPLPTVITTPYVADYWSNNAKISGVPLMVGDVITAVDPNGVVCGKTVVSAPGTYLIHVMGNDSTSVSVDEGAVTGDQITFYLDCTCALLVPTHWASLTSTQFDANFDCAQRTASVPVCDPWTLMSFNVTPPDPSLAAVLSSISGEYSNIFTSTCADGPLSWDSGRPINDLTSMDPFHGYWLKVIGPAGPISITGVPVPVATPMELCEGWNLISYLPEVPDTFPHALGSITGQYSHIFGFECGTGYVSWDANRPANLNDLNCMKPMLGYWIKATATTTLTYPSTGYVCNDGAPTLAKPVNLLTHVTPTPWVMDYWSVASASVSGLQAGDHLTARTKAGVICGECVVGADGAFLMHVYGDDPTTKNRVEGATAGEVLHFEINDTPAVLQSGSPVWSERQSVPVTVTLAKSGPLPTAYALLQNYPNPFNPSTVIMFRLPVAADAKLTIYNVLGQTVRQLFSGSLAAGDHSFEWNGQDQNGRTVQSGIYFYRLDTPSWSSVKKMTFLK